jgi:hypothetical protein
VGGCFLVAETGTSVLSGFLSFTCESFSDQLLLMGQQSSVETRSCPVQIVERIVPFRAAQFYSALTRKSGNERLMQR